MTERRSSRSNKGKHSQRDLDELVAEERGHRPLKKAKVEKSSVDDDDEEYANASDADDLGEVRCVPCGTNKDNYDEATDKGGTFIQCDECNTWQHAKCMGFGANEIPDLYMCDVCDPVGKTRRKEKPKKDKKKAPVKPQDASHLALNKRFKDEQRLSTAKAFYNYFKKSFQDDKSEEEKESLATDWAIHVEGIILENYPDKRYIEGGRRVLYLLKKQFMADILDGSLTFEELVKKTPAEINQNIEKLEEKIKSNIKNIILTAHEPADIIRRTHKGDIIRENENDQMDEIDINITSKKVDHRIFESESEDSSGATSSTTTTKSTYIPSAADQAKRNVYQNMNPRINDDDDDEDEDNAEQPAHEVEAQASDSESSELEHVNDADDDADIIPILTGEKPEVFLSRTIWSGRFTFPDFATFEADAEFYSCTGFAANNETQKKIMAEILIHQSYNIEGRLDKLQADAYLNKITSSRNLYITEIKSKKHTEAQFQKLYQYLLIKNKVGVLSGRPWFVKDAYLMAIDFRDEYLPEYLGKLKRDSKIGLFALYTVKRDYAPRKESTSLSDIMSQLR